MLKKFFVNLGQLFAKSQKKTTKSYFFQAIIDAHFINGPTQY